MARQCGELIMATASVGPMATARTGSPFTTIQRGAATLTSGGEAARRYLLVLRFVILNSAILAFLVAAWLQGWLDQMVATDSFHIIKLIALLFLVGLHQCGSRILQLGQELNALANPRERVGTRAEAYLNAISDAAPESRPLLAGTLRLRFATRLGNVRYIANLLVLLGLIGTVAGFIVALGGISPSTAGDLNAIGPMVSSLLQGMSIALYTTLAGSLLNIWLMLNYRLLEHGTVHVYTKLVELGERQ
jgi:biopolymer transport protein ExbB/TolQ